MKCKLKLAYLHFLKKTAYILSSYDNMQSFRTKVTHLLLFVILKFVVEFLSSQ